MLYALDETVETPPCGRFWVAPNASVIGKVKLGVNVGIWFGAVLRGDLDTIEVGEGSNIQDNCVLHTDPSFPLTVGRNCTVGHLAMLHGCTIKDHALVGIGAVVLNGAVIGEHVLIGANALVPEGKVIPPRSMVLGSPGRVVRELRDDEVERMAQNNQRYVKNWQRFRDRLQPMEPASGEEIAV